MAMPTWIHEAQALGSTVGGVAAAAIAYAGIRIAHRQSVTAAQKLRLDMFPLRYAVYQAAFYAIIEVTNEPNVNVPGGPEQSTEKLRDFLRKLLESRFLFDKESYEYFNEIHQKLLRYKRLTARLRGMHIGPEDPKTSELYNEQDDIETWLIGQLTVMATKLESQMKVEEGSSFSRQPVDRGDLENSDGS